MRADCWVVLGASTPRRSWAGALVFAVICGLLLTGCRRTPPPAPVTPPDSSAPAPDEPAEPEGPSPEEPAPDEPKGDDPAAEASAPLSAEQGKQLYVQHCTGCHGDTGDGVGLAAAFLFPKPRDFRAGRFRLVSTSNLVPLRQDLHDVLLRGMPGSSMPPWKHLSKAERDALVDEIMRMRAEGARASFVRVLKEEEEYTDEEIAEAEVQDEIREFVDRFTTPGETSVVPEIPAPTDEAIARGKVLYEKTGCAQCHGKDGKGDGVKEMFDDEKLPTTARDFTAGVFKGGHDAASLYRRTAYGMPGTPMPSSSVMTPEQMVDLVHFIRAMSSEEQRSATILNREHIVAKAVKGIDAGVWSDVKPVRLQMAPLWWRTGDDPSLSVQAVHDGKKIAVRLTWRDAVQDRHAARSESFEDAIAMELYRGDSEPFLGMGAKKSAVDVWFWDADRQGKPVTSDDIYPNKVVDSYPFSEKVVTSAELNREGARTEDQPDVSLPARASGNPIVPNGDASGGSSLTAGGPGSVTFRIPRSPLVEANGQWSDGSWTVVMSRTLGVASKEAGVSLAPGDRASVAFAVWDGSQKDRDGKKLITIWQDFELEPLP